MSFTVWPAESSTLREFLGVDSGASLCCHGMTQKNKRCQARVSQQSSTHISRILSEVVGKGSFEAAKSLLSQLSQLVMCKKNHQYLAATCLQSWEKKLASTKASPIKTEEKEDKSILAGLQEKPPSSFQTPQLIKSKPLKAETKTQPKPTKSEANSRDNKSSIPTPSVKSSTPKPSKQTPKKHEFDPFGKHLSIIDINNNIKNLILRPLTKLEKSSGGCIYIYTFPENYHDSAPYLKIGNTENLERRMASWERQCKYKPSVLSNFRSELYVKVEKLVHAELRNQRKREVGCPACGIRHKEWFDVRSVKASTVIALWTEWTRQKPYDDNGNLKKKWVKRVQRVDLSDRNCWEEFVSEQPDDHDDHDDIPHESVSEEGSYDDDSDSSYGFEGSESDFSGDEQYYSFGSDDGEERDDEYDYYW